MNKKLICYFSASGVTKKIAENISNVIDAELFEIEPVERYTKEDLDWTNEQSRSSKEMKNREYRPKIKILPKNIEDYNTVLIGFPVWWYTAPTIVNTFIESVNLNNKNVYVFVTSGSSSYESSLNDLREKYPNINFISGNRFNGEESKEDIINWIN